KRLVVNPGEKLSLQMHHHRAEHWVVVQGTARVERDGETILISENESAYIPSGTLHRLENPGRIPLHLVEVQTGAHLEEDDLVRFDDAYGRCPVAPAEQILVWLRAAAAPVSGAELARRLGCSRTAVWKHVAALRRAGAAVDARRAAGHPLPPP